jgi:carboxylesterase
VSEVDPSAFDLGPAESEVAVLCVHGLTGTPYEVRPIAEVLAARGMRARGLLLPGHGTTPEELARTPRAAWLAAVGDAVAELRGTHARVALVGMSLGGVLSLRTAQRIQVDAVVSIGAPLVLGAPVPWVVPFAKHMMPMLPKRQGSDIRDAAARARHPGYKQMPLAAVHELVRLQREVIAELSSIRAPLLVAHGVHDRTAHPRDAQRIHDSVSSEARELVLYPRSGHVVPVDYDGAALAERAAEFLGRHLEGEPDR